MFKKSGEQYLRISWVCSLAAARLRSVSAPLFATAVPRPFLALLSPLVEHVQKGKKRFF